jgi:hypothetical protein
VNGDEVEKDLMRAEYEATNALRQALYTQEMSALRGLHLVNAGGAVALLAFLGQIWISAPELRIAVVVATGLFAIGSLLAVVGGFLLPAYFERRYRQNETGSAEVKHRKARRWYYGSVTMSFSVFLLAVALLIVRVAALS